MNPAEFEDGPGQIEPHGGLPCYNPASLPPELEFTEEILEAHGDALYALGQLSTLHDHIENENLLLAPFVVREAAMSSQIEGTAVTVSDIILHEPDAEPERSAASTRDIREAYNYVEAIQLGFDQLQRGNGVDQALLCELHESLLLDVRGEDKRPGEIRDTPVVIGPNQDPQNAQFIPAHPAHVQILVDQLIAYNRMENYPPLIDIALSHYQFETIHPFRDGNGRLGRLLIMLQLFDAGLLDEPYLYLSAYFNRNRAEYFDKLLSVSKDGAWEEWVLFALTAISDQAHDAYECGQELLKLRNTYLEQYEGYPAVRDVVTYLFEEPYLQAGRAQDATGRSKKAVYNAIDMLVDDGVIEEITGKERGKIYQAPEILAIVESP
ncbi:Fic family protein [Halovenus salina]|uniref:Fic family protein n=1 Tax=Halovenus salina TaxID=1510225 RepID=A0ABD5WBG4_9EURY|nr:Fic/DOC family N-terminal domain-containing protein [Halovenus salina]